jgi:Phage-related minor tail protein
MANNDLKIKIVGSLNTGKSIGEINTAIKGIEKKINKLNINLNLDKDALKMVKTFNEQFKKIEQLSSKTGKIIEQTILPDGTKVKRTFFDGIKGEFSQVIDEANKTKESVENLGESAGKSFKNQSGDINKLTDDYKQLARETKKYNEQLEQVGNSKVFKNGDNTLRIDTNGDTTKLTETLNPEKAAEAKRKEVEARKKLESEYEQWWLKNLKEQNLAHEKSTQKMAQDVKNYQKSAQIEYDKLKSTHRKTVNHKDLDEWLTATKKLDPSLDGYKQSLKETDLWLKKIKADASEAARSSMTFGNMMSQAMVKFPIWMISATMFYAPLRAMQDMTARLVEIDTLMVDIQRVMDAPDYKFVDMLDQAVISSDQLSSKLTDFLKIMGDFGRMGFEEDQLMDISKTATVLQNISDLDAKDSVDTLTSAMLNFNIAAEDSVMIADKLNEIDNNFAVSTKDLSDGLRKSASTAKTFGVEIDTLLGYIAAIGSTTRESGAIIGKQRC